MSHKHSFLPIAYACFGPSSDFRSPPPPSLSRSKGWGKLGSLGFRRLRPLEAVGLGVPGFRILSLEEGYTAKQERVDFLEHHGMLQAAGKLISWVEKHGVFPTLRVRYSGSL